MKTFFSYLCVLCAFVVKTQGASISNTNAFFRTNSVNDANLIPHENTNNATAQRTMATPVSGLFSNRTYRGTSMFSGAVDFSSSLALQNNLFYSSALIPPSSNLTNYVIDVFQAELWINATNNVNISALGGSPTVSGNWQSFWGITITNMSGSNWLVSVPFITHGLTSKSLTLTNGKWARISYQLSSAGEIVGALAIEP